MAVTWDQEDFTLEKNQLEMKIIEHNLNNNIKKLGRMKKKYLTSFELVGSFIPSQQTNINPGFVLATGIQGLSSCEHVEDWTYLKLVGWEN